MDVEPEPLLEQRRGNEDAIAGDDHSRCIAGEALETFGLLDTQTETIRDRLGRRGLNSATPTPWPVWTRQKKLDLEPASQPLEYHRAEGRRRGDGDP